MAYIAAVSSSFPPYYYSQDELIQVLQKYWETGHRNTYRLERIQRNTTVEGRYLVLPMDAYERISGFGDSNRAWIEAALDLGEDAVCALLDKATLQARDISYFTFTTVTGIAVPSIDARLMNRIPFPGNMKRNPLFGLGCLGGAAGIARVADYLKGHPQQAAILLSIELCSLTLQRDDISIENIVSSGLFGDGAGAVLMLGDEHPLVSHGQPKVIDSRSTFFPQTEHIMGWDVRDSGLKVILSADVAAVAEKELRPAIEAFLADHHLAIKDITHWVSHPGGPKVIQAIEDGLGLDEDALAITRRSLAEVGNISSTSVLIILQETLARRKPQGGEYGLLMAMGPAFCAEFVLLKW